METEGTIYNSRENSRGELRREDTRGKEKKMRNRLIDRKITKQILVDAEMHRLLKIKATEAGTTLKAFVEGIFAEVLAVEGGGKNV